MRVTAASGFKLCLALLAINAAANAQDLPLTQSLQPSQIRQLDPTRGLTHPDLESSHHQPLPEEYIWTSSDTAMDAKIAYTFPKVTEQTEPHYFRERFNVASVPQDATLYIAGPRSVKVWLNGQLAEQVESDLTSPLGMHVFITSVAKYLHAGANTIAIEAVRGRGVTGFANSALLRQETFGQVVVAKIIAQPANVNGPALMRSGKDWKSSTTASENWQQPGFDDSRWKPVQSIGGIESSLELFQWNADAGLYNWPGYDGISGYLAHLQIPASGILSHYAGRGSLENLDSLTGGSGEFTVHLPARVLTNAEAPSIVLDFGRELTGRVEIVSDSGAPATLSVQMGESESETMKAPFLGVNQMTIAPHGTGHSSKTAFRYARIQFLGGAPEVRFKAIRVDHIYYPVEYQGSFESSDPILNRIWEIGAYTAHLCMQDGVWDASKRDRGRWMGDTDVSGRVIEDVFGERPLMEDTLDRLMGPAPIDQHVNGIPGYSAFWFTGVADYYRHSGSKEFLSRTHDRMVQLLEYVDREFDARNIYVNKTNVWLYVDWSPEFNGDTPETRRATTLEFYRAYREGAWLLREAGDTANAAKYEARADAIKAGSEKYLLDPKTNSFGPRWQSNAAAVVGGAADPSQYSSIWKNSLASVGTGPTAGLIISPYYNYYVIRAMAEVGHRAEALRWIRTYWGGMVNEGATSFWEAYDPDWYKEDFHSSLQSDNRSGYFVSLAHGWSAGPTAWLMEQVLGINPTGAGFNTVDIRPDLVDLTWAKGAEPTPHGLLKVDVRKNAGVTAIAVDVPEGVAARVSVPGTQATVNGKAAVATSAEGGTRTVVMLDHAGHFELIGK
ncbi:Bacterial alpha-L-rhamnosidase [Granulicella sp. WH15]|uniref:alpha-L-rhamnosidase-related protein n=1 Tax=Granulicella sp. WH15 TaxID=2602070 RepID=UPI0013669B6A|nr:alpha-L-rhamnosidase C-terminal domain-containing protein [Granulicella sp. WH15]QHN02959.1 Bacterial alpha-L-rhamnosidase [Granulicella sp. WH15]